MGRILFLTPSLSKGGAERVIARISNSLIKQGHDVTVACLLSIKRDYFFDERIKIVDITEQKRNVFSCLRWIKKIRAIVKQTKPTSIISFIGRVNILALLSLKRNKVIVSERNDPRHDGRSFFAVLLCKLLYLFKAKKIVFQTKEIMDLFPKRVKRKSVIIRNPIPEPIKIKKDYSDFSRIIMVGRLEKQKNYELAINAMSMLRKKYNLQLDIFGSGNEESSLKHLTSSLGLSECVNFKGLTDKPDIEMLNSSIFLLTSWYEGLSNSLMEAMSLGLPCVTTPVSGSNEIVVDGVNGLLLNGFSCDSLTTRINDLVLNADLRQKIGMNAYESMKTFYENNVINEWLSLINDCQ